MCLGNSLDNLVKVKMLDVLTRRHYTEQIGREVWIKGLYIFTLAILTFSE